VIVGCIMDGFKRFLREDDGGTAMEYAIIAAIVAVIIIFTLQNIGTKLNMDLCKL